MADINRRIAGVRAKNNGKVFEARLEAAFEYYRLRGEALIEKTPEPVKQLGAMDKLGRFMACYEKRAQPDYKGVLRGGKCIVIEAKHTNGQSIPLSRVTPHQLGTLLEYEKHGAEAYIIAEFGDGAVRRYRATMWNAMIDSGLKTASPGDPFGCSIEEEYGIIKVLEGIA